MDTVLPALKVGDVALKEKQLAALWAAIQDALKVLSSLRDMKERRGNSHIDQCMQAEANILFQIKERLRTSRVDNRILKL